MCLVYHPGKPLQLLSQNTSIQALIRRAMEFLNAEIIFMDAFPSDGKQIEFSCKALISAALDLKDENILRRIECEPSYLKEISKPVHFDLLTMYLLTSSFSGKHPCQPIPSRSQTTGITDHHQVL
jgi:hypothetical protein